MDLATIIMAAKLFGLTPQLIGAIAILAVLAPLVIYWTVRSNTQIAGSRAVYQEFAQIHGLTWSPPKNEADTLGPGRIKGRYLDHKISIDATAPTGAARDLLPETVIRVHFSRSLGLGLNAGSGSFRARNPGDLELADPRLTKMLRPKAKDGAGARQLLGDPAVVAALLDLEAQCGGVAIDDGTLACAIPLPISSDALRASVDRLIHAVDPFDRALTP